MRRRKRAPREARREGVDLSELQLAVVRALWRRGEASVADVRGDLLPDRRLAPTTVATTLARLERRGVVAHRTEGRQYLYRALLSEADVRRSMVLGLTARLFAGDSAALVTHLVEAKDVDLADLDRIRAALARRAKEGGPRGT